MSTPNNGLPVQKDYYDDVVTEGGPETVEAKSNPNPEKETTSSYQANPNEVVTES
ncbi:hypothetical protein BCR32DRAFT_286486, partial [Anaeromyces robustus]